ncbi:MAG: DNA recombination protein RmuC [Candidatus Omnitrophica bacterium]|nr:DNA recombination protein RmuC [Candidatus Omnitrophota bacterium]
MEFLLFAALFILGIYLFFMMTREFRREMKDLTMRVEGSVSGQTQNLRSDVSSLTQEISSQLRNQNQLLHDSQRTLGERLEGATRVVGEVQNRLGRLESASQQIFDLGREIRQIENILKAPKLRGIWSELYLDELIGQVVPKENYVSQYTFKNGATVDAVIILTDGIVPIDAKFPLENFRRILEVENEEERRPLKVAFANNVKKHIDDIHNKYILPNEGTFDFALMYIPAENVYYEILSGKDDVIGSKALSEYARSKKVIPVSPSTFFSYLQTILLGLKGMRIEQGARTVLENLSRLKHDFERFTDDFRVLGNHLRNATQKYGDCEKVAGKFQDKLEKTDEISQSLQLEPSAAALEEKQV